MLLAVNSCLAERVYLLANDPNVALAAREVVTIAERETIVVATRDVPSGLAVVLELANAGERLPTNDELLARAAPVRVADVFFAGKDSQLGGVALKRGSPAASLGGKLLSAATIPEAVEAAARELGAEAGGLLTLYYGGAQKERDARQITAKLAETFDGVDVEYYYGGQRASEYVISLER